MSPELRDPQQQRAPTPELHAPPAGGTLLVIAGRCGRLANRTILFANFIAFAEEHGHRLINCTFHSYAPLFETTRRDIYCQYPVAAQRSWLDAVPGVAGTIRSTRLFVHALRMAAVLNERWPILGPRTITFRGHHLDPVSLEDPQVQAQVRSARRVFLLGWTFRAPGCVQRHADKIRAYFQPVQTHANASRLAVERLRLGAEVVVGVHLRRGDYSYWRGGRYFFPVERYAAWMRELADQFPARKVSFLVCSDEARDAREFPGLSVGFGTGLPLEDVCALARCDYVMGPVSSFSQWASFYGNKPLYHLRDGAARIERSKFAVSFLAEIPH